MKKIVNTEKETAELARQFSKLMQLPLIVGFIGDLGAGKTTFIRKLIKTYKNDEVIKSPTFGLVEEYNYNSIDILHADLYRIKKEEKNYFDFNSYYNKRSLFLIEWIENDSKLLKNSDILISITISDNKENRFYDFKGSTIKGKNLIKNMQI